MSGSTYGELFKVTTFGESHGGAVGCVLDGCPAGLELSEEDIQPQLNRRRPGQSEITTPRNEADTIKILSGVFEGKTTGTPIMIQAHNKDVRSSDYDELKNLYRPSHADFTYTAKYGFRDWRGSGRASARETLARVAAGAVAQKLLKTHLGVSVSSFVQQVGTIRTECSPLDVTQEQIEASIVRCPDTDVSHKMISLIEEVQKSGDSVGGVICGVIRGVPAGLGEPVFDKLHAELGKAMLSINAVKGFEIGRGFESASMRGSEHNDPFVSEGGEIATGKNDAGGVLGGISTGAPILFRVAFKPVATISKEQDTVKVDGTPTKLSAVGRHDPCVVPRAVPIVDAMAALVIADMWMRQRAKGMEAVKL